MKTVTIYSTPNCHFCHLAKEFFTAKNISFTDIDVAVDMVKRAEMLEMTGQMGVPVISINEEGKDPIIMVGFNEGLVSEKLGMTV
jgi:glutaredoxin